MYWPIGAPRIYAASSSAAPKDRIVRNEDDIESPENTEGSGSLINAPSLDQEGKPDDDQGIPSGLSTPVTPFTPGIKPVEHDSQTRDSSQSSLTDTSYFSSAAQPEKESILALRISRTGHLFAVITATTLAIWQTKVHS